jgi:hypothetical protein
LKKNKKKNFHFFKKSNFWSYHKNWVVWKKWGCEGVQFLVLWVCKTKKWIPSKGKKTYKFYFYFYFLNDFFSFEYYYYYYYSSPKTNFYFQGFFFWITKPKNGLLEKTILFFWLAKMEECD